MREEQRSPPPGQTLLRDEAIVDAAGSPATFRVRGLDEPDELALAPELP